MTQLAWMSGEFGIMCHYLSGLPSGAVCTEPTEDEWNARVNAVDTEALAEQVASTGASWLIFTLGQNSGYYCSPNATYDRLVGRNPSRLSDRDLLADVAASLSKRNVRTIAYQPSHAPADDRQAVEGLVCTPDWNASHWQLRPGRYLRTEDTDERLSAFQRNWEAVVREWSTRWGSAVSAWWIDGCYYGEKMYHHEDEPNLASFAAALKSGNPEAAVAFNPGVMVKCYGDAEDYTAGETMHELPISQWKGGFSPLKNPTGNSQLHILAPLGKNWRQGEKPRFKDTLTIGYSQYIMSLGGGITWDVPISPQGVIPQPFIGSLQNLGDTMA